MSKLTVKTMMLEKYKFSPARAIAILLLILSLLSTLLYLFVFVYYSVCWGLPSLTTLFEWTAFLLIPTVFSIWGIVRTVNLSKFNTKLTRVILLIVIGLGGWYAYVMELHDPRPPLCWGCAPVVCMSDG
jgi:hypothetical protein